MAACTAPGVEEEPRGVGIHMDFRDGAAFWDAPFPSEHRRGPDGTIDMTGFPRQDPPVAFVDSILRLADGMTGFGTTSGVFFRVERGVDETRLPTTLGSQDDDALVFLMGVDPNGPDFGVRVPVDVRYRVDGGPYAGLDLLSLLPFQGRPLYPDTLYAAVVMRDLNDWTGERLAPVRFAGETGELPDGPGTEDYIAAFDALEDVRVREDDIAGLAVFRTQDPVAEQRTLVAAARAPGTLAPLAGLTLDAVYDDFCVYRGDLELPVFQSGEAPFLSGGGEIDWQDGVPVLQGHEPSRLYVTVPRSPMPAAGWPSATFVRTGGGGDLPLMERGVRDANGIVLEAGTGPARELARVGWAGVQIDGPHGGPRNVSGGDEQFLMFNVTNPPAMRDNVRQSALELALVPDLLEGLEIAAGACPGGTSARFDGNELALMGHSMGATIAPLVLSTEPRYASAVLSGAGGSWIHNVVHKLSPLETRPLAESMLGYDAVGRTLDEHDIVLSLLQWVGESADPPVHAAAMARRSSEGLARGDGGLPDVLMFQGVVDTYILPPMAHALSASLALKRVGERRDETAEWPGDYLTFAQVAFLSEFPDGFASVRAAALAQHEEDGVEDGHEVMFQLEATKQQYRCFLRSVAEGAPAVPVAGCD